jgi:hypothetical protein
MTRRETIVHDYGNWAWYETPPPDDSAAGLWRYMAECGLTDSERFPEVWAAYDRVRADEAAKVW